MISAPFIVLKKKFIEKDKPEKKKGKARRGEKTNYSSCK